MGPNRPLQNVYGIVTKCIWYCYILYMVLLHFVYGIVTFCTFCQNVYGIVTFCILSKCIWYCYILYFFKMYMVLLQNVTIPYI